MPYVIPVSYTHLADEDDMMVLKGSAPVSMMRDYQTQVTSYTKGRGRLFCSLKGYAPCQNQDEIDVYKRQRLLPLSALFGASFLIWCDVACRVILKNSEMPIGVLAVSYTHLPGT